MALPSLPSLVLTAGATPAPIPIGLPGGSPIANRTHPRVWFTADQLPAIRANLAGSSDFQTFITLLNSNRASAATDSVQNRAYWAMDYAFAALTFPVSGIAYGGRTAADYQATALACFDAALNAITYLGYGFHGLPVAYDWLASSLTAAQRSRAATVFAAQDLPSFFADTANPFNSQVGYRKALAVLAAAALAGDGVSDAWASDTLAKFATWLRGSSGVTNSQSVLAGKDGWFAQGVQYDIAYTLQDVLPAEEGYRTANGIAPSVHYGGADASWFGFAPIYWAYTIRPWSHLKNAAYPHGQAFLTGPGHIANQPLGVTGDSSFGGNLAGLLRFVRNAYADVDPAMAGLAQWLLQERVGDGLTSAQSQRFDWVRTKFVSPRTVSAQSPSALGLPLSRRFAGGMWVFRTGWDSPSDTLVTFHAAQYLLDGSGYTDKQAGYFTVDRSGPAVTKQGHMQHDFGTSAAAGFCSTIVFPDTPTDTSHDQGGSRIDWSNGFVGAASFADTKVQPTRSDVRELLSEAGRDVDYVHVDLTRAYDSPLISMIDPPRVSSFVRQFVYFRESQTGDPARIVVFDRSAVLDTKYEQRAVFTPSGMPTLNGTSKAFSRNGTTVGHLQSSDTTRISATNTQDGANNTVHITPILPTSRLVRRIGGPNALGQRYVADSHECEDVNGVQQLYAPEPTVSEAAYSGDYRIEIVPATPQLSSRFLTVVEVTAANGIPSTTTPIQGTGFVGVAVGNRIAVFGLDGDRTTGTIVLNLPAGAYRLLLTNLTGPSRTLAAGANVALNAGLVTLDGAQAVYLDVLIRAAGTSAANTITVS